MRIIDRYVIREVLWPFVIGLLVFTFMLIIPYLIEYAESFISKGVPVPVVLRVMGTLLPSALALTIPMSLLLGLLVAFGRLSADRAFVGRQGCGVRRRPAAPDAPGRAAVAPGVGRHVVRAPGGRPRRQPALS